VAAEIAERHAKGQPVLVGTVSIEKSERLSKLLKKHGIAHQVLNAKYHEREAEIVAQAGREKTVTIATNMAGARHRHPAGRQPDFLAKALLSKKGLDPATAPADAREAAWLEAKKATDPEHERVVQLGGLHIIGTERHESRRVDNQLRAARAARATRARRASTSRSRTTCCASSAPSGSSASWTTWAWKRASRSSTSSSRAPSHRQKRVETRNFEIRKHLLEYDDVMNKQREIVYGLRREVLAGESQEETVLEWIGELAEVVVARYAGAEAHQEDWDMWGSTRPSIASSTSACPT